MTSPKFGAGFQRPVYRLKFRGALAGLEVDTRSAPIATFTEIAMLAGEVQGQAHGPESMEMLTNLAKLFQPFLLDWNMTDDNEQPVPLSAFLDEGFEVVTSIVMRWLETIGGVIDGSPLASSSPSGGQSPEPPAQTEPQSPAPLS